MTSPAVLDELMDDIPERTELRLAVVVTPLELLGDNNEKESE